MIDLLEIEHVLDAATLAQIRREMGAADGDPATVLGPTPQRRVMSSARTATRIAVREETYAAVVGLLERLRPRIEVHFGRSSDGGDFIPAKVKRRELRLPTFHALRHGAAMDCDDAEQARDLLRHKNSNVTRAIYRAHFDDRRRELLRARMECHEEGLPERLSGGL